MNGPVYLVAPVVQSMYYYNEMVFETFAIKTKEM